MKRVLPILLCLIALPALAQVTTTNTNTLQVMQQTATGSLTITIQGPLALSFTPSAPNLACGAAAGSVVAAINVSGGDGKPVSVSMTGDTTDFALSATALPANVIVGPNGIAATSCGANQAVMISATQP